MIPNKRFLMNLQKEDISKIIGTAVAKGGDFADLYFTKTHSATILSEENKIQRFYRGFDMGCGIRVMKGDFSTYLYTNDCTVPSLIHLANEGAVATGSGSFGVDLSFSPQKFPLESQGYNLEAMGEMMKAVNDYAKDINSKIRQVSLGYGEGSKELLIANSQGIFVESASIRKRFFVKIVVEHHGDLQTAMSSLGDTNPQFLWTEEILKEKTGEAIARALQLLDAREAPSGEMTVILSSSAGGTMVHEACGHGLEADHIAEGLSVYKDKLGASVASEKVTVIDDATIENAYGSYVVDDEGNPGRENVLIEKGILKSYLYDSRTAKKMGKASTGNGRRESYRYTPQVRMSNTYIAKGNDDPQEILRDTKKGLFVKKMGGGQVNTTNGDFVFEVSEGYLIENGALTYPVKNATLIGNGPKTLSSVFAVGNDLGFAIGTCGKGGQSVAVGDAQPTLGLSEVVVGGTAK